VKIISKKFKILIQKIFYQLVLLNLKLIYTDSAKVKAILYSDLNKDFTNQSFPYSEFPEGVKITFYDNDLNETIVTSDYAITYNKTNIVNLIGNVVINN